MPPRFIIVGATELGRVRLDAPSSLISSTSGWSLFLKWYSVQKNATGGCTFGPSIFPPKYFCNISKVGDARCIQYTHDDRYPVPEGRYKNSPWREPGESSYDKHQPRTGRQKPRAGVSPSSRVEEIMMIDPHGSRRGLAFFRPCRGFKTLPIIFMAKWPNAINPTAQTGE